MGLGPLVPSATTSSYATYAACCSAAFNLESIFYLHNAELNETMGLAKDNFLSS